MSTLDTSKLVPLDPEPTAPAPASAPLDVSGLVPDAPASAPIPRPAPESPARATLRESILRNHRAAKTMDGKDPAKRKPLGQPAPPPTPTAPAPAPTTFAPTMLASPEPTSTPGPGGLIVPNLAAGGQFVTDALAERDRVTDGQHEAIRQAQVRLEFDRALVQRNAEAIAAGGRDANTLPGVQPDALAEERASVLNPGNLATNFGASFEETQKAVGSAGVRTLAGIAETPANVREAAGTLSEAVTGNRLAGQMLVGPIAGLSDKPRELDPLYQVGQRLRRFDQEMLTPDDPNAIETIGGGAIGSAGTFFMAGGVTRALGGGAQAANAVAAMLGGSTMSADAYEEARQLGAEPGQAAAYAAISGGLGMTDALPFAAWFRRSDAATGGFLSRAMQRGGSVKLADLVRSVEGSGRLGRGAVGAVEGALTEATQEVGQEAGQNLAARATGVDSDREVTEGLGQAALGGLIAGGGFGGAVRAGLQPAAVQNVQEPVEVDDRLTAKLKDRGLSEDQIARMDTPQEVEKALELPVLPSRVMRDGDPQSATTPALGSTLPSDRKVRWGGIDPSGQAGAESAVGRVATASTIEQAQPDDPLAAAATRLEASISTQVGRQVAVERVDPVDNQVAKRLDKIVERISEATGSPLVIDYFKTSLQGSSDRPGAYGGVLEDGRRVIHLDINGSRDAVESVLAHELAHDLKQTDRELFDRLVTEFGDIDTRGSAIRANASEYIRDTRDVGGIDDAFRRGAASSQPKSAEAQTQARELQIEEGLARAFERSLTQQSGWQRLARDETMLTRLADAVRRFFAKIGFTQSPESLYRSKLQQAMEETLRSQNEFTTDKFQSIADRSRDIANIERNERLRRLGYLDEEIAKLEPERIEVILRDQIRADGVEATEPEPQSPQPLPAGTIPGPTPGTDAPTPATTGDPSVPSQPSRPEVSQPAPTRPAAITYRQRGNQRNQLTLSGVTPENMAEVKEAGALQVGHTGEWVIPRGRLRDLEDRFTVANADMLDATEGAVGDTEEAGPEARYSRAELERRIDAAASSLPAEVLNPEVLAADAANQDGEQYAAEATAQFAGPVPTEVREALEGRADLRMLVRGNVRGGRGEDYLAQVGTDTFVAELERLRGGRTVDRQRTIDTLIDRPELDPQAALDALVLRESDGQGAATLEVVLANDLLIGETLTAYGREFEVIDRDGERYLSTEGFEVPIAALDTVPMDRWSRVSGASAADLPFSVRNRRASDQFSLAGGASIGNERPLFAEPERVTPQAAGPAPTLDDTGRRLGITQADLDGAARFTDSPSPAYAAGVADYLAGRNGIRKRDGMNAAEGREAQAGFRAAKAGASSVDREDVSRRKEQGGGDGETGMLFAVRRAARSQLFNGFHLPSKTTSEWIRIRLQDKFIRAKIVQDAVREQGGVVDEETDTYLAETLYYGRAAERVRKFRQQFVNPIVNDLRKAKVTIEELDRFLYAKHAPERNKQIAKINPQQTGLFADGSGMSDAEAKRVMAEHAQRPQAQREAIERVSRRVYALNKRRLHELERDGLLSTEARKAMLATYEFYVPLRTDETGDEINPKPVFRTGQGFSTRGKQKRALGRTGKADSPLLFALGQYEEAAIRAEKNRVGQAFLKFVQANPDPDVWEIDPRLVKKYLNEKTGQVQNMADFQARNAEDVLSVMVDGEAKLIQIKDSLLARAMKNAGAEEVGGIVRLMQRSMRFLSTINTSYNPEFVVSNLFRDAQTAGFNLTADESAGVAKMAITNIPEAIQAVYTVDREDANIPDRGPRRRVAQAASAVRQAATKPAKAALAVPRAISGTRGKRSTDALAEAYREFRREGAKTGWFYVPSLQERAQELESLARRQSGANPTAVLRDALDWVNDANGAVENAIRLSAYAEMRERGMSPKQAASMAKNLTVNFNRKGELGNQLNAVYLFYNASIQGSVRVAQALASRRGRKMALAAVTGMAALDLLNRLVAGADDDGENHYEKIPDYVKDRNLIIMLPGGEGRHVKFPLPYGFNVLAVLGQTANEGAIYAAVDAGADPQLLGHGTPPAKAVGRLAHASIDAYSPIGTASTALQQITPTLLQPFVQIVENKDFAGRPVYPRGYGQIDAEPDAYKAFDSSSAAANWTAQTLNRVSGGDRATSGLIDVHPDVYEHLSGWMTGGLGTFVGRAGNMTSGLIGGELPETYRIPFVRKLYGTESGVTARTRFYEQRDRLRLLADRLKTYFDTGEADKARAMQQEFGPLLALAEPFKDYEKLRRDLYDQLWSTGEPNEAVQKQIDAMLAQANRQYRAAEMQVRRA